MMGALGSFQAVPSRLKQVERLRLRLLRLVGQCPPHSVQNFTQTNFSPYLIPHSISHHFVYPPLSFSCFHIMNFPPRLIHFVSHQLFFEVSFCLVLCIIPYDGGLED